MMRPAARGAPSEVVDVESKGRNTAAAVRPIFQRQRSAVRLGDLAAENQSDARALRLRREERNEEVGAVRDSRSFVLDRQRHRAVLTTPPNLYPAVRLERRIHRV